MAGGHYEIMKACARRRRCEHLAAATGWRGPAGVLARAVPVPIAAQCAVNLFGAPPPLRVLLAEHVLLEVSALELLAEWRALRSRVQRGSVAPRNSTAPLAATLWARVGVRGARRTCSSSSMRRQCGKTRYVQYGGRRQYWR